MVSDDIITKESKKTAKKIHTANMRINSMLMGYNAFNKKPTPKSTPTPKRVLLAEVKNSKGLGEVSTSPNIMKRPPIKRRLF